MNGNKIRTAGILSAVILLTFIVVYNHLGWFDDGDMEAYLKEQYQPEGKQIVSAEYMLKGGEGLDGYIIYQVQTADGSEYLVCADLRYKLSLQVGLQYKVKGFRIVVPAVYGLDEIT